MTLNPLPFGVLKAGAIIRGSRKKESDSKLTVQRVGHYTIGTRDLRRLSKKDDMLDSNLKILD